MIHNGLNGISGYASGYCFDSAPLPSLRDYDVARSKAIAARDSHEAQLRNAWRRPVRDDDGASGPGPAPQGVVDPDEPDPQENLNLHLTEAQSAAKRLASYQAYKAQLSQSWQYNPSATPWKAPGPLIALAEALATITRQPAPYTNSSAPPYSSSLSPAGARNEYTIAHGDAAEPDLGSRPREMTAAQNEKFREQTFRRRDADLSNAWRNGGVADPRRAVSIRRETEAVRGGK